MSESRHRKPCVYPVDVARVNRPAPLRGPELVPLLLPAPPLVINSFVDVGWEPIEDGDQFWRER